MKIDEIELRVIRIPFRSPFKTSFAIEHEKYAVIATVRSDGVEGYGEGVMDPLPIYREESIASALHLLREAFGPDLVANGCEHPEQLSERWARWRGNPMAKATLELAVWDCFARQHGVPLCSLIGGVRREIAVGASLGMNPIPETLDSVRRHIDEGYRRIKLKIEPGWDIELLDAVRNEFPSIELSVDANAAYTREMWSTLLALDQFGLHYIEQPLHWDDLSDHARLAEELATAICLDESLTSPARVRDALDLGACSVVNVKVGRVGGLQSVREIHDLCVERNVPMWCGGMLETGIGRAHNIHLATMPGFVFPGDTASASRTYERDITEQELTAINGIMPVPPGPGIGVTLDATFLASVTESSEIIR